MVEIQDKLQEVCDLAFDWLGMHGRQCRCHFCAKVDADERDSRGELVGHTMSAVV